MIAKRYHLNKFQIISHAENTIEDILKLCKSMDDHLFFYKSEQWSVAENLEHLSLTLNKSWLYLFTPKIILKWKYGKPTQPSKYYEELLGLYHQKLDAGYETEKRFMPVVVADKDAKERLIARFEQICNKYLDQIRYYWEDDSMDQFHVPNAVFGFATIRELVYFNLFHNTHHYKTIRSRKNEAIEFSSVD